MRRDVPGEADSAGGAGSPPAAGWAAPVMALDLPHGRCVGIAIPAQLSPALLSALHRDEQVYLTNLPPDRQPVFAAGRVALRTALVQSAQATGADLGRTRSLAGFPLIPAADGAPRLPRGTLGSISHKRTLAIALAAPAPAGAPRAALGVDLEEERPLRVDIARRVLTAAERVRLNTVAAGVSAAETARARDLHLIQQFSLKEAFYKAVNGFGLAYVSFQNVEVASISADGAVVFAPPLLLQQQLEITGWLGSPLPGFIVASARAQFRA